MSENDKKKPEDDLSDLIPRNANIGIVSIANGGGIGMIGTSGSPIVGIATSGGPAPARPKNDEDADESGES